MSIQSLLKVLMLAWLGVVPALALADSATENACRQMAEDEAVPKEDIADYIAECVAVVEAPSPEEAAAVVSDPAEAEQMREAAPQ